MGVEGKENVERERNIREGICRDAEKRILSCSVRAVHKICCNMSCSWKCCKINDDGSVERGAMPAVDGNG